MASTIAALYGDSGDAEAVAEELKRNGFPIDNLRVEHDVDVRRERSDAVDGMHHGNLGMMEFFTSLLKPGSSERSLAEAHSGAMRQSNSLIVVHAQDGRQADRATDIMNRHHPIVVDERA